MSYEDIMADLQAALEKAVNDLHNEENPEHEGYMVLNKWAISLDFSDMNAQGRYHRTMYPFDQAPWDSKGLLDQSIDAIRTLEIDDE